MTNPKVFIFAPGDASGQSETTLEGAGCEWVAGEASWHTPQGDNEDAMCAKAEGAHALMGTSIRSSPISRRIMETSKDLRIVAKFTIGVDDIDVEAATELGILVTHAPTESNWGGVAEGTIAMILALLKKTREKDETIKAGGWREPALQGTYLGARGDGYAGITLGLVGLGRIGVRLSKLLAPWRMRIIACDPYVEAEKFVAHGVEAVDFPTLLKESDIVSLHVTLTRETTRMMGAAEFAMMKPDAVFINTSRGKTVYEAALAEALIQGRIAQAAIDVFEDEPLGADSPLIALGHKVLLSPHTVSSNIGSGLGPGIEWGTRSVLAALNGEVPDNVFNIEVIPRWRERFGGTRVQGWPSNR